MIGLDDVSLIDGHCHTFDEEGARRPLHQTFSLSLHPVSTEHLRSHLVYQILLRELAHTLGCSGEEEKVLAERARRLDDYEGYVRLLFEDVNIEMLLVDVGYHYDPARLEEFLEACPVPVRIVYRAETLIDRFWRERIPFAEAEEAFRREVTAAVRDLSAVALKSIIAYRTGLDVQEPDPTEARAAYERGEAKPYRDYFFHYTLAMARELGLPLQVHTGFGDSDIDLRGSHATHLRRVLEREDYAGVPLIFLHAGTPYSFETGYLCAMYDHVYVDLSELIPFAPSVMEDHLRQILGMAPISKVLFGSDGFTTPESLWLGAKLGRRALARCLTAFVEREWLSEGQARAAAQDILRDNARRLYRLDG